MFRVRFQTMLVIMVTACVTIFAYDSLRERVETIDFESVAASWKSKPPVQTATVQTATGVTIKLPVLATTTVNTVVSVPDGGTIIIGGGIRIPPMNPSANVKTTD